jgi:hypothetical protein
MHYHRTCGYVSIPREWSREIGATAGDNKPGSGSCAPDPRVTPPGRWRTSEYHRDDEVAMSRHLEPRDGRSGRNAPADPGSRRVEPRRQQRHRGILPPVIRAQASRASTPVDPGSSPTVPAHPHRTSPVIAPSPGCQDSRDGRGVDCRFRAIAEEWIFGNSVGRGEWTLSPSNVSGSHPSTTSGRPGPADPLP